MNKYTINLQAIKDCAAAVSKDTARYHLCGVYVEDRDNFRHYVATDGHIMVHFYEESEDKNKLEKGLILKLSQKIGKIKLPDAPYAELQVINEEVAIIKDVEKNYLCDIVDGTFPDYWRVIPQNTKPAEKYAAFDPKYTSIAKKIMGSFGKCPEMEDETSPALFKGEKGTAKYEIVLMPMRY